MSTPALYRKGSTISRRQSASQAALILSMTLRENFHSGNSQLRKPFEMCHIVGVLLRQVDSTNAGFGTVCNATSEDAASQRHVPVAECDAGEMCDGNSPASL